VKPPEEVLLWKEKEKKLEGSFDIIVMQKLLDLKVGLLTFRVACLGPTHSVSMSAPGPCTCTIKDLTRNLERITYN
jgi:hypothetical protein